MSKLWSAIQTLAASTANYADLSISTDAETIACMLLSSPDAKPKSMLSITAGVASVIETVGVQVGNVSVHATCTRPATPEEVEQFAQQMRAKTEIKSALDSLPVVERNVSNGVRFGS